MLIRQAIDQLMLVKNFKSIYLKTTFFLATGFLVPFFVPAKTNSLPLEFISLILCFHILDLLT
jgi:hypothetical protein